jgi:hypothetical protein
MQNRFNRGDCVIALTNPLDSSCQYRIKGNTYKVHDVLYCSNCGEQSINIEHPAKDIDLSWIKCDCEHLQPSNGKGWTYSRHFFKPEDADKLLQQAIEIEDYDTAIFIRDIKVNEKLATSL